MTDTGEAEGLPCALWLRVSTSGQHTENQAGLAAWAARRGLRVVAVHELSDSAWTAANGKGREFDAARRDLLRDARSGRVRVVLIWALDRLTRRGPEDALSYVRQLTESGC
jgi:DNA invertase Pin-like site-specific DNA recombinase